MDPPEHTQEPSFSVAPFATEICNTTSTVTCAATSSKFVVLGLSDGSVSLFDVFGNQLDHHQSLHPAPLTTIALGGGPAADQVVSSASADGQLRAARLFTGNTAQAQAQKSHSSMLSAATLVFTKQCESPVSAIAVDPAFGKPRFGNRVAFADTTGRVVIHTAGWFGGTDVELAPSSNLPVPTIFWVQNLLAFPAPDGVRVYDTRFNRPVCHVAPPGSSTPPSPMTRKSPLKSLEQSLPATATPVIDAQHLQPQPNAQSESDQQHDEAQEKRTLPELPTQSVTSKPPDPLDTVSSLTSSTIRTAASGFGWELYTSVFMEEDTEGEVSPHGEPSVRIYVTWPAGARILLVGPHREHTPTPENPAREINVIFKVERDELFQDSVPNFPPRPPPVHEAPLLAMVPFGEKESVALVGTPMRSLALHLISAEGKSMKNMFLPQRTLRHAHLLTVPGGDPLVLIVAHRDASENEATTDISSNVADVVFVRSLTTAERVKWLLGQNRFQDALNVAQSAPGGSLRRAEVSIEDVGEQFLESLKEARQFERLANVIQETIASTTPFAGFRAKEKVMQKRKRRWERWLKTFRGSDQLDLIVPAVPTFDPVLDKSTYNQILVELTSSNGQVMLEMLKTWPSDLYNVSTITKAIEVQIGISSQTSSQSNGNREFLREGLLMMYGLSGRHDETLNILLREKSPKVYDYIRAHHLYEAVRSEETISGLYSIDPAAATTVLSRAPETVLPPEAVVPILTKVGNPEWTFMYLHAVFRIDPDHASKYHNLMLTLYVQHGPPGTLFNFLKTSSHYSLDRALREMGGPEGKGRGEFAKERVYILSAMGDLNSAMNILLDELGDTFAAIEFASDHGDTVLWERLIDHARTHADTLAALLDSPAGGKVDPVRLIPLLNSEMKIPHLRDRLHRILVDAALERALREDATAALRHDAGVLLQKLDESVTSVPL